MLPLTTRARKIAYFNIDRILARCRCFAGLSRDRVSCGDTLGQTFGESRNMRRAWLTLILLPIGQLAVWAGEPQLISVKRIWDQGKHNAFTDLIRFQDNWYCTFREADAHVGGDGKIRVLTSRDGETWESAALLAEEGIDLRDPKLSITIDNYLM